MWADSVQGSLSGLKVFRQEKQHLNKQHKANKQTGERTGCMGDRKKINVTRIGNPGEQGGGQEEGVVEST